MMDDTSRHDPARRSTPLARSRITGSVAARSVVARPGRLDRGFRRGVVPHRGAVPVTDGSKRDRRVALDGRHAPFVGDARHGGHRGLHAPAPDLDDPGATELMSAIDGVEPGLGTTVSYDAHQSGGASSAGGPTTGAQAFPDHSRLRDPRRVGARRHGGGLQGPSQAPGHHGGAEDGAGRRPGLDRAACAVRGRGPRRGPATAPEHRPGLPRR